MCSHCPRISINQALKTIRGLGLSANYNLEFKEFRVTFKHLPFEEAEDKAYYTDDALDAVETAKCMLDEPDPYRIRH